MLFLEILVQLGVSANRFQGQGCFKMRLLVALCLLVAVVCADDAVKELQQGNLEFSAALYQQIVKTSQDNLIVSPLSAQLVLALTQLGARGETALELSKGLHLPNSPEKIKEAFKALTPQLKGNQFYSLSSANKVYLKEGFKINPEFLTLSQEIFDAGLENIDFAKAIEAAASINQWVESKTNGKIKDLIDPQSLDELTRMVLINAIHFKANWSSPFDKYGTFKRKFFKSEKEEIEVETMRTTETFKYYENKELDTQFLEIPYEGGDVVFTLAVPNKKEGLKSLEGRLVDVLRPQNYSEELISLFMPKFLVESTLELVPVLKELGIKKPFDDKESDLSGLLVTKEPLVISKVIQKAFINVTETGTEAAAATAVLVQIPLSAVQYYPEPRVLRADRPFIYTITHVHTKQILFVGRINKL